MQDFWKKMLGKSAGMMENGVMRTVEETQEEDVNSGDRDVV